MPMFLRRSLPVEQSFSANDIGTVDVVDQKTGKTITGALVGALVVRAKKASLKLGDVILTVDCTEKAVIRVVATITKSGRTTVVASMEIPHP